MAFAKSNISHDVRDQVPDELAHIVWRTPTFSGATDQSFAEKPDVLQDLLLHPFYVCRTEGTNIDPASESVLLHVRCGVRRRRPSKKVGRGCIDLRSLNIGVDAVDVFEGGCRPHRDATWTEPNHLACLILVLRTTYSTDEALLPYFSCKR